jgi:hypothetical protein
MLLPARGADLHTFVPAKPPTEYIPSLSLQVRTNHLSIAGGAIHNPQCSPRACPLRSETQMKKVLGATALAVLLGATAAMAQTTSPASPPASKPDTAEKAAPPRASTTTVTKEGVILTEAQASAWIKKAIFSSDGKKVGDVTALKRDASGKVAELQAGIGGFLGMGETQVRVMPEQFKLENDRVLLSLTAEQVKALPKIAK